MTDHDSTLTLSVELLGNGKTQVFARFNERLIFVDTGNLSSAKFRAQFTKKLIEKVPAAAAETIEEELLRLAEIPAKTAPPILEEMSASSILRPEYHATESLVGLAVPVVRNDGGKPSPRWMHYIRWNSGCRECRELASSLEVADGTRLLIYPMPTEPAVHTAPAWSAGSRRAWLDGAAAPDPPTVFRTICERIAYYLDFPREAAAGATATLAVWSLMTYGYSIWSAVPYLYIGGPLGSGKSTAFAILNQLVFRPLNSSNMTAPAVFRTLHERGGSLLLDEAERLKQSTPDVQELLSILLAGYKQGGSATRLELVGDNYRTVAFDVFGPKALAAIAGLPPALASRCVPITMFRAGPDSPKPRRRVDADPAWAHIRDDLHVLSLEHGRTWIQAAQRTDVCPPELAGRAYELWQPLLGLAAWLDSTGASGLLEMMQRYALNSHESNKDEQVPDADEILLEALAESVKRGISPTPGEILDAAKDRDKSTFEKWSARTVSNRLKAYGITTVKSCVIRTIRGTLASLERIQHTYGIDLGIHPSNSCAPCATVKAQDQ